MQQTIFFSGSAFGKDFLMVIVQPPCAVTHINKSAGGRLRLNSHTPLTKQSQSGLTMPLCRESMGTYQESSSHAIRQGTLSHSCLSSLSHYGLIPGLRSRISVNDLISTLKKKGAGGEWIIEHFPQILMRQEKATNICAQIKNPKLWNHTIVSSLENTAHTRSTLRQNMEANNGRGTEKSHMHFLCWKTKHVCYLQKKRVAEE